MRRLNSPYYDRSHLLLPLLAMAMAVFAGGCDTLTGTGPNCFGDSSAAGTECHQALQGIPPFPPPPCWNEAGEIQSDEVCARVHEARRNAESDGNESVEGDRGELPGPPELPN